MHCVARIQYLTKYTYTQGKMGYTSIFLTQNITQHKSKIETDLDSHEYGSSCCSRLISGTPDNKYYSSLTRNKQ